ncbi:hypothetical protein AR325_26805 [Serratia marcescens]|nr:hypothetical protein AR325_26805 [Serratia marcescens]
MRCLTIKVFPTDGSVKKGGVLALQAASQKWTMPQRGWRTAMCHFIIEFGDRLNSHLGEKAVTQSRVQGLAHIFDRPYQRHPYPNASCRTLPDFSNSALEIYRCPIIPIKIKENKAKSPMARSVNRLTWRITILHMRMMISCWLAVGQQHPVKKAFIRTFFVRISRSCQCYRNSGS